MNHGAIEELPKVNATYHHHGGPMGVYEESIHSQEKEMIRQAFKDNIHPNKRKVQSRFPFFRLAGDCNFYIDFNMGLVIETWKNFACSQALASD